ncbi:MAG: hypothetical protein CM1200mP41_38050 [Gammaproteobacteria bacterium]|nr:MAG: hypothetical protein CM1200mP41_38050 [Gammaproteobacteria bacterium]
MNTSFKEDVMDLAFNVTQELTANHAEALAALAKGATPNNIGTYGGGFFGSRSTGRRDWAMNTAAVICSPCINSQRPAAQHSGMGRTGQSPGWRRTKTSPHHRLVWDRAGALSRPTLTR